MQEELELEIRSQLLNPAYQDSLLNNPSGWLEYASRYKNLFGMDATTGSVTTEMWTLVAKNLLDPKFSASNDYVAFATQSMLGWTIEAARRNMWQADSKLLKSLTGCLIRCGNLRVIWV